MKLGGVRKGTKIEVVGGSELVEKIKIGDLIYSFNRLGVPSIKKVIHFNKLNNHSLFRVHFKNIKGNNCGYIDLSPECYIKLFNGKDVKIQHIRPNMSICFMQRSSNQLINLSNYGLTKEFRFVYTECSNRGDFLNCKRLPQKSFVSLLFFESRFLVSSIEEIEENDEIFNLSIEETNNFVGNGISISNY